MAFSFLPRESDFFTLFNKQADHAVKAAELFTLFTTTGGLDYGTVQKMRTIEHQADEIAHDIMNRLNKTFITPFDREDIHELACSMDDVIDMIYTITNRMYVYKIHEVDSDLMEFASIIEKSVRALAKAIEGLQNSKNPQCALDACIEVNRLENVGDTMRDAILGRLFENATDTVHLIKWKEIYLFAETVLDMCEDVAHVVESIFVKQA